MREKIPFYNIVNIFFVGAIFSIIAVLMFIEKISIDEKYLDFALKWNVLVSAVLVILIYEIGFIINRISSITIEPILTNTKIWPRDTYDIDVSEISENNSKFQSMITELNLMRSHILIYLFFSILSVVLKEYWLSILFFVLVVIFILAGRKHNAKINKIRKSYSRKNQRTQNNKQKQNHKSITNQKKGGEHHR